MTTEITQFNPADIISQELTTSSTKVAEIFGKTHAHVLQKIDSVITQVSDSFNKANYRPIEIDVEVGFGTRKDRAFEITKDGFMLLVMGFTGKKAMQIKIAYINAFNWMSDQLSSKCAKKSPVHSTGIILFHFAHGKITEVFQSGDLGIPQLKQVMDRCVHRISMEASK